MVTAALTAVAAVGSTVMGMAAASSAAAGAKAAGNAAQAADQAQAQADSANAEQQLVQGSQQRNIQIAKGAEDFRNDERTAGAVRAAYGGAGVTSTSGTPLLVASDAATENELTRQMDIWQGLADQQASDTQGEFDVSQARSAMQAGVADKAAGAARASAITTSGYASALGQIPGDITAVKQIPFSSW